jgi:hypothetical protein
MRLTRYITGGQLNSKSGQENNLISYPDVVKK